MSNLVILSEFNLYYGHEAGTVRMNNYAKAISGSKRVMVFLISSQNFVGDENLVMVKDRIFTSPEKKNLHSCSGFRQIKDNLIFARAVDRWSSMLTGKTSYLIYPSVNISFEFFLLYFLKFRSKKEVYYELNEIRNSANIFRFGPINLMFRWVLNAIKFKASQLSWRAYDGLICISTNIEKFSKSYNENVLVVPILSDFDGVQFQFWSRDSIFRILFTGHICLQKENLKEFIFALSDLDKIYSNWTFELTGPISSQNKKNIEEIIRLKGLGNKVKILGILSSEEIVDKQKKSSLLVSLRSNKKQNYYNFSTKLAEYAISGTPILMTNTGMASFYFRDNYNCYMVNGFRKEDFYQRLLQAISEPESQRHRIANNAYYTAMEHFAYYKYAELLISFLKLN